MRQARAAATVLLLLAIVGSGCGLAPGGSARDVGTRFSDSIDGRSTVPTADLLAPDADVYLQGGLRLSRQAFLDHLDHMRGGYQFFHRMSRVYATRGGAAWLLDIVHASDAETAASQLRSEQQATLWLEATIVSGKISRLWIHFTVERLQSLLQSPSMYAAKMAAEGLPLPDGWADGTPAVVAAAEALDAEVGNSQSAWTPIDAAPMTAVAAGLLVLRVLVARRQGQTDLAAADVCTRNRALLVALRERRERAHEEADSERLMPV
jgi:hypothetical protein